MNALEVVRSEQVDSCLCEDGGNQMAAVAGCVANNAGVESRMQEEEVDQQMEEEVSAGAAKQRRRLARSNQVARVTIQAPTARQELQVQVRQAEMRQQETHKQFAVSGSWVKWADLWEYTYELGTTRVIDLKMWDDRRSF